VTALCTEDVVDNLERRGLLLVDARTPERFRGEVEPLDPVAGHIPGAVLRPWQANLGPDGRFKSPAELRAEFTALLSAHGTPPSRLVATCGSGVSACHHVLAMAVAGFHEAPAIYSGSWSEWVTDPRRPVALGSE
jgi:thiosulfate/3-mercaptopyruvate sulfurtransferase